MNNKDIKGRPTIRKEYGQIYPKINPNDDTLNDQNYEQTEEADDEELPNDSSSAKSSPETANYRQLSEDMRKVDNEYTANSSRRRKTQSRIPEVRSKPNSDNKKSYQASYSCNYWVITVLAVVMALIASFFLFDGKRYFTNQLPAIAFPVTTEWTTFETDFKSFEQKYSEVIPNIGLRVLNSSVRSVMTRNKWLTALQKTSPAIILLIASKDNQNLLKCVERDFVNTLNKAYNENDIIVINGKQTKTTDIIDKFDLNFRDNQKHTIVIENIESIDPKDVQSLHQFTDHENAKYKDVVIVLTAINYQNINLTKTAKLSEMDSIATKLFEIKWKNALPEEQSFALISRLTTSVVTIIGQKGGPAMC